MKKKINWGNWFVLILFSGSTGFFLGDVFNIMCGHSFTWLGAITGLVNMIVMCTAGIYIWEGCHERK